MAGVVLVSIPPIIVFLLMRERFVRGIAATGLKDSTPDTPRGR